MSNIPVKVLFKINSDCNRRCDFCPELPHINSRRPPLEKDEIIANFRYLGDHFRISSVIITGGEPTLHPDYFTILDYFFKNNIPFKVISNLTMFQDRTFSKMHQRYFQDNIRREIFLSINHLPSQDTADLTKGLKNIIIDGLPASIIIVAYKGNLEELPGLIEYLHGVFGPLDALLRLELRLPYVEEVDDEVVRQAPQDFSILSEQVNRCLVDANSLGIAVTLWNLPLCYTQYPSYALNGRVEKRKGIKIIKIDKECQFEKFKTRDFKTYFFKTGECILCKYNRDCSGINRRYIEVFMFPLLKPIIG